MHLLELVPRDLTQLQVEAATFISQFPKLHGINVPDVKRLDIRSVMAAAALLSKGVFVVPHIRAMDYSIEGHLELISPLVDQGLTAILIVAGDPIQDQETVPDHVHSVQLIQALKNQYPTLKVYGALDPYRQSFTDEVAYCKKKLSVGADGFFTQPFFDIQLARKYLEELQQTTLFLGASPVISEKSKQYWERVNKVVFPVGFELTLPYNTMLTTQLITLSEQYNQHIYMMPLKVDVTLYLEQVYGS
jgi:methylenetetrahydrofolate reductase (NADPH)